MIECTAIYGLFMTSCSLDVELYSYLLGICFLPTGMSLGYIHRLVWGIDLRL